MPSVPIEMPSLTPMVLKRNPTSPAAARPSLTFSASRRRCMLQGLPSYQTLAMPTWGFVHVFLAKTGGVEHGLRGALRSRLRDSGAELIQWIRHTLE